MYRTMHRQPADLAHLLLTGWPQSERAADLIAGSRRVFLTGIGTSYHAALVGEGLLRGAGLDARAVSSFDLSVYPDLYPLHTDDAVIVMAHTGTKQFSTRALDRAAGSGCTVISVGSTTAEHPGSQLVLRTVVPEESAAYTASHTGAMFALAQVATRVAQGAGLSVGNEFQRTLDALPEQVRLTLDREDEILAISAIAAHSQTYVAGAGPNAATACEAVIKAREAATARIDGLALEQFLHGPIVSVNAGDVAVVINVKGAQAGTVRRCAEVAGVLARIGTSVWLVGQAALEAPNARIFELPEVNELLSPILAVIPMQVFAYQMAVERGANPDHFRLEDPHYAAALTVEL